MQPQLDGNLFWILSAIITAQFFVLGLLLKFLFAKASNWGEKQEETNKQLALINQTLVHQKEKTDKHEHEITSIWKRLTFIADKLAFLMTTFEVIRFAGCKEDCPVSEAVSKIQGMSHRESKV
jgi:septal ring factor EnvC (AmiA/AmiB activator)